MTSLLLLFCDRKDDAMKIIARIMLKNAMLEGTSLIELLMFVRLPKQKVAYVQQVL